MTIPDELPHALRHLESLGIAYALTGSLAAAAWGRVRATFDADVVIELHPQDVERLLAGFPAPTWYVDCEMALEAIRATGEFNAVHAATGTKIYFWLKGSRPADVVRFLRRRRETVAGVACWLLSPEDIVLAKLEWISAAPSQRQQGDVAVLLAAQAGLLDLHYLRDWADRLSVRSLLEEGLAGKWDDFS